MARYTPLAKESAISQQELDDAVQANLAAKAQVEQAKAAIESARAAVESAKLNLGFTKIVSPIDGVAGIATAQIGDFVEPTRRALDNSVNDQSDFGEFHCQRTRVSECHEAGRSRGH